MKSNYFTICFIIFFLTMIEKVPAQEILIDNFAGPHLSASWQKKSFVNETYYLLSREDDIPCLKAVSNNSASGMYYKIKFNPAKIPFISWSWKINSIIASGNALHKDTDDYAARVYIIFPSLFFWKTRAINYIWANRLPLGSFMPSPYTSNGTMIAVESGSELTGQWVTETRNIYEDYKKAFRREPPMVGAIAIMTDSDNTGEAASACYGEIRIHSTPAP